MKTLDNRTVQDAKNRFSTLVEAALKGRTQWVSRRGKPAVVVLSVEGYQRLCTRQTAPVESLTIYLLAMPHTPFPADEGRMSRSCRVVADFLHPVTLRTPLLVPEPWEPNFTNPAEPII